MSLETRLAALASAIAADIKALLGRALPAGGATGQVLAKSSATDYATQWVDQTGGGSGDVAGPSSATGNAVALFDGTTGKLIKDSTKLLPSGDVVGTTDTQTLTAKTLSGAVLNDGYTEEVFAVSGTTPALSPTNGSIQTWTLTGNSTPTAGTWAAGQSITLMVDDGTAYTINWTSLAVVWKTDAGSAPTLNTTGYTAIALWKVGTTIYGARVGDA